MSAGLFNADFEILRLSETSLGGGKWSEVFGVVATARGRLSPLSPLGGADQILAAQEIGRIPLIFACAASVDLRLGDHVRHPDGREVDVRQIRRTSSGRRIEAICEEIERA